MRKPQVGDRVSVEVIGPCFELYELGTIYSVDFRGITLGSNEDKRFERVYSSLGPYTVAGLEVNMNLSTGFMCTLRFDGGKAAREYENQIKEEE